MRRTGLAVAALAVLALVACTDDDPAPTASASAPPTGTPTTSVSTTPVESPPVSWPTGCPSPTAVPAGATVIEARVAGGKVTPPRRTHDVDLGSRVRLVVLADVADEVHVHSYDLHADTKPGCPAVVDFQATIPGSVEVELEDAGLHLLQVRAR